MLIPSIGSGSTGAALTGAALLATAAAGGALADVAHKRFFPTPLIEAASLNQTRSRHQQIRWAVRVGGAAAALFTLFATAKVVLPANLSEQEKELFRDLKKVRSAG